MCSPFTDCCANRLCYSQHEAIIADGMLDAATTVMAIWPAPMIYAGPTEVRFLDPLLALFSTHTADFCTHVHGFFWRIILNHLCVSYCICVGWLVAGAVSREIPAQRRGDVLRGGARPGGHEGVVVGAGAP